MNIDAKLSIIRTTSNCGPTVISIEITDEASSCRIVELKVSLENFAEAITGLGYMPCKGIFYENAPIGKVRQIKHEKIPFVSGAMDPVEALLPYEVDGWKGNIKDLTNPHRKARGNDIQMVMFTRFVERAESPEKP